MSWVINLVAKMKTMKSLKGNVRDYLQGPRAAKARLSEIRKALTVKLRTDAPDLIKIKNRCSDNTVKNTKRHLIEETLYVCKEFGRVWKELV